MGVLSGTHAQGQAIAFVEPADRTPRYHNWQFNIQRELKARTMFEHFTEEKLATPEELQRVACPVGVKIRSQTPQEIAVTLERKVECRIEQWVTWADKCR